MKQRLFSFFISAIIFVGLLTGNASQVLSSSLPAATWLAVADVDGAEPVAATEVTAPEIVAPEAAATVTEAATPEPVAPVAEVAAPKPTDEATNLLTKLETEIIPQIESVLTPEQQAEFATKVAAGTSFRKAFKAVTLTPAQKTKLSAVFKAIPKKGYFCNTHTCSEETIILKK